MNIQMTRLYEAAKALRGIDGQSDVARALNASPQTINNWEARGISKPGLLKAQAVFGCSATWLESGLGPMTVCDAEPQYSNVMSVVVAEANDPNFYHVPKVQLQLRAGVTGFQTVPEIHDGSTLSVAKNWVDRNGYHPNQLIAVTVKGDSMEPNLYEGDMVIINTADTKMSDGAVYAFNYEGEAVIKRLSRDAGQWWLASDNPDQVKYRRKSCRGGECIIVGRIVRRETDRI
ncbi:XRE family transcriptional regulator [Pseudoduganella sp. HUAS MS19]